MMRSHVANMILRKFKFPLKSPGSTDGAISPVTPGPGEVETISPRTPNSTTVPSEPATSISGVLTDEPVSAAGEEASGGDNGDQDAKTPIALASDGPIPVPATPEVGIETAQSITSPAEPSASTSSPNDRAPADIEVPDTLTSSEPLPIATSIPPATTHKPEAHHAQSIDEAIADFQTAIKTPEPESITKASEALSATEKDGTSVSSAQGANGSESVTPTPTTIIEATNGHDDTQTNGSGTPVDGTKSITGSDSSRAGDKSLETKTEISATAPRRVVKTPVPATKEPSSPPHTDEGEGTTMEDIEID
jgi:hypothetical protein